MENLIPKIKDSDPDKKVPLKIYLSAADKEKLEKKADGMGESTTKYVEALIKKAIGGF